MDIYKVLIFMLLVNAFAIFRFVGFSRFNRKKAILGIVGVNLAILLMYLFYVNNDVIFSQGDIAFLVLIVLGALFTVFYVIEKKKK